jgi:hypothetical protein
MLQYGFERNDPVWVQGPHDAAYKEKLHRLSNEFVHDGQRSETIQLDAERGSFIHYTYPVGHALVSDDLSASIWLRATRPGLQLLARVVFPRCDDPKRPGQPLTALVEGDRYQAVSRWQQLSLPSPVKLLRQQQQLLSRTLKREVDSAGAYVDQLVLNVYAGPGDTRVWIDDLAIGPVDEAPPPSSGHPTGRGITPGRPAINRRPDEIQLIRDQLLIGGDRFFLMGIRHTGTPLPVLRRAGFNTVWLDESTPSGLIEDAANLGFWIVPTLHLPDLDEPSGGRVKGQLTANNKTFAANVARFRKEDAVLCWDLGGNLPFEQASRLIGTARAFHELDSMRPLAADITDGFRAYRTSQDQLSNPLMIGTHRWPLLTGLELTAYRNWLIQRRRLMPPDTFNWTWIQTHLPDWFMTAAYERTTGRFTEPIGPHPEQIRLLAYTAIGSGYRGLGYWSDRFLADSHLGHDRLLALASLNQEFRMLEPLLVATEGEPVWIDTSHPFVKAAVLRSKKAILVLAIWMGPGSQYVPAQGFVSNLTFKVMAPENYSAWEISPGRFRSYPVKSVLGGREITIQNFNLTAAIVLTGDLGPKGMVVRFQEEQLRLRKDAAQWTHDQAQEELVKVARIHEELTQMGKTLDDGPQLLDTAREWLAKSHKHRLNGEFTEAYNDAHLALRAVRLLQREHWDAAVRRLTTPVACPFAVSFFTLPRFWRFVDEVRQMGYAANVLPEGDFEAPADRRPEGWKVKQVPSLDDVETQATRVATEPRQGKQCLMLKISPKSTDLPPQVLERTCLALQSPAVRLPPGTLVRISAWSRVPAPLIGSPDGALLYDSAGGEPLAVRLNLPSPWKKFILYRRVPASGTINVTMALTGMGTVYFDDVRIEPIVPKDRPNVITTAASSPR